MASPFTIFRLFNVFLATCWQNKLVLVNKQARQNIRSVEPRLGLRASGIQYHTCRYRCAMLWVVHKPGFAAAPVETNEKS